MKRLAVFTLAVTIISLLARPADPAAQVLLSPNKVLDISVPQWHFRTGVPFPKGALKSKDGVSLMTGEDATIPVQTEILATWAPPDHPASSIKWLGLDFQAPVVAGQRPAYRLEVGAAAPAKPVDALRLRETQEAVEVETSCMRLRIRKSGFNFLDRLDYRGGGDQPFRTVITSDDQAGPYVVKVSGERFLASRDPKPEVRVEYSGPLAAVVRAEGWHRSDNGETSCRYVVRFYFYAGVPFFRVQHTFVITEDTSRPGVAWRDIGLRLPVEGETYAFGAEQPVTGKVSGGSAYLLQKSRNAFKVVQVDKENTSVVAEGTRAAGWVSKPGLAVVVRDFPQNFPKELEMSPKDLRVHFWPGHGETDPNWKITAGNAWRLGFVHRGPVLDFRVPGMPPDGELFAQVRKCSVAEMNFRTEGLPPGPGTGYYRDDLIKIHGYGPWKPPGKWQGVSNLPLANALGLAKTHDMLFVLGDPAAEEVDAYARVFQESPHVMADPKWVCASGTAGALHPHDSEQFPWREKRMALGMRSYLTQLEASGSDGMFNYGGTQTSFKWDGTVGYYRLWNATHHGKPRVPWLLYLRSGDPVYLDFAMANARHVIDTDVCHWTTGDFARRNYHDCKRVGGLCDYKGVVHWHAGGRVGYNSMVDFALYDYYLTGNRRAWDVVREMGEHAVRHGIGHPSRHGAGVLATLLEYYKATWDPKVWEKVQREVPKNFRKPGHLQRPSCNWAPWLERYLELTGDEALRLKTGPKATHERARTFLLDWADWIAAEPEVGENRGHSKGNSNILTTAYLLTKRPRYARAARALVDMRGDRTYENRRDRFSGWMGGQWYAWAYWTQYGVYGMTAASTVPRTDAPYWNFSYGPAMTRWYRDKKIGRLIFHVHDGDDRPIRFRSRMVGYCEPGVTCRSPKGRTLKGNTSRAKERFELDIPPDGERGWYRVETAGPKPFQLLTSAALCSNPTLLYGIDKESGLGMSHWGACRFYFWVPKETARFSIHLGPARDIRMRCTAFVHAPDETVVDAAMFPPVPLPPALLKKGVERSPHDKRRLEVEVPPEWRGGIWSLGGSTVTIKAVEGIPPFFAARPEGIAAMLKSPPPNHDDTTGTTYGRQE